MSKSSSTILGTEIHQHPTLSADCTNKKSEALGQEVSSKNANKTYGNRFPTLTTQNGFVYFFTICRISCVCQDVAKIIPNNIEICSTIKSNPVNRILALEKINRDLTNGRINKTGFINQRELWNLCYKLASFRQERNTRNFCRNFIPKCMIRNFFIFACKNY